MHKLKCCNGRKYSFFNDNSNKQKLKIKTIWFQCIFDYVLSKLLTFSNFQSNILK